MIIWCDVLFSGKSEDEAMQNTKIDNFFSRSLVASIGIVAATEKKSPLSSKTIAFRTLPFNTPQNKCSIAPRPPAGELSQKSLQTSLRCATLITLAFFAGLCNVFWDGDGKRNATTQNCKNDKIQGWPRWTYFLVLSEADCVNMVSVTKMTNIVPNMKKKTQQSKCQNDKKWKSNKKVWRRSVVVPNCTKKTM